MQRAWYRPDRAGWLLIVAAFVCVALLGRVVQIKTLKRAEYVKHGRKIDGVTRTFTGVRGVIRDRSGRPLAASRSVALVAASPAKIRDWALASVPPKKRDKIKQSDLKRYPQVRAAAAAISAALDLKFPVVLDRMCMAKRDDKKKDPRTGDPLVLETEPMGEVLLVRDADPRQASELVAGLRRQRQEQKANGGKAPARSGAPGDQKTDPKKAHEEDGLGLNGVYTRTWTQRYYPGNATAGHVIGHCSAPQDPLDPMVPVRGVESQFAHVTDGEIVGIATPFDGWGRRIFRPDMGARPAPLPGKDLYLTIDSDMQKSAEKMLADIARTEDPIGLNLTVYGVNSGEIICMASYPTFDPNRIVPYKPPARATDQDPLVHLLNRPASHPMEPGSTFKILTVAAGLHYGVINAHSRFDCKGHKSFGRETIHCWGRYGTEGHGSVDPETILALSCNVGAAAIADLVGTQRMNRFLKSCGIGRVPHSGLDHEAPGFLRDPSKMQPLDLATQGFGQGVSVTDLQMVAAVAAILNGGQFYHPHIVRAYAGQAGLSRHPALVSPRVVRQICKPSVSKSMRRLLQQVVDGGTGGKAKIEGRAIGGKTATAQIYDRRHKRWFDPGTDPLLSFILVGPVDRSPDFVVMISAERPLHLRHGSDLAPYARQLAEMLLARPELFRPATAHHQSHQSVVGLPDAARRTG